MPKPKRDQYKDLPRKDCARRQYTNGFTDLPPEPCGLVNTLLNLFSMRVSSESDS